MSEQKKEYRNLEVFLSDEEILVYSKSLTKSLKDKQRAEDRLKEFKSQMKFEIDGLDANINLLSEKVSTGREYRDIECFWVYDWEQGTKDLVRKDVAEIVKTYVIGDDERQTHLELEE